MATQAGPGASRLLLAVYAPLGGLAGALPAERGESAPRRLLDNLAKVARCGVDVAALLDPVDGETVFVRIEGGPEAEPVLFPRGKMAMEHAATLARFVCEAHAAFPAATMVLALEGRGGGFVPVIDRYKLAARSDAAGGTRCVQGAGYWMPVREDGTALVERGAPLGLAAAPNSPPAGLPIATHALGQALADAAAQGVPRLAVLLLNGSFGMSVEVLHTVMPHADYAVGYPNHNFFSAGATFPIALCGVPEPGAVNAEQLAARLVGANHALLGADGRHPTVGCAIRLARLRPIVDCIDDLADALLAALRQPQLRPAALNGIRGAIRHSQQYDTEASLELSGDADELIDLAGFAAGLAAGGDIGPVAVAPVARALQQALAGIKHYGDSGVPWFLPNLRWDFSYSPHAMNIFMPDPLCRGLWDWRSPHYLDPSAAGATAFQKQTDWIDFIVEYHRDVPFQGLLPAALPPVLHQVPAGAADGGSPIGRAGT